MATGIQSILNNVLLGIVIIGLPIVVVCIWCCCYCYICSVFCGLVNLVGFKCWGSQCLGCLGYPWCMDGCCADFMEQCFDPIYWLCCCWCICCPCLRDYCPVGSPSRNIHQPHKKPCLCGKYCDPIWWLCCCGCFLFPCLRKCAPFMQKYDDYAKYMKKRNEVRDFQKKNQQEEDKVIQIREIEVHTPPARNSSSTAPKNKEESMRLININSKEKNQKKQKKNKKKKNDRPQIISPVDKVPREIFDIKTAENEGGGIIEDCGLLIMSKSKCDMVEEKNTYEVNNSIGVENNEIEN